MKDFSIAIGHYGPLYLIFCKAAKARGAFKPPTGDAILDALPEESEPP